jgi:hypothetical protein
MSEFTVGVNEVEAAAALLASICGDLEGACSGLGAHSSAGSGTSAEAAVSGFITHLVGTLPGFGASTDRLRAAVAASGAAYSRTDADVAAAAGGGGEARDP